MASSTESSSPPDQMSYVDIGIDELDPAKEPSSDGPPAIRGYDNISMESRSIISMPEIFDGFNFTFARAVNSNMQLEHSISCAGQEPESYNFSAMFGTANMFARGRVDTDGNVNGVALYSTGPWKFSAQAQAVDENPMLGIGSAMSIEAEYTGNDFIVAGKWTPLGAFHASYTQKISPSITTGVQGFYSHDQALSLISGAIRVEKGSAVVTGEVSSRKTLEINHLYKVNKKLSIASDFKVGPDQRTGSFASMAAVGWQYTGAVGTLKSLVTSQRRIACYYEEKFTPNISLTFSGEIDYPAKSYRLGFGLSVYA